MVRDNFGPILENKDEIKDKYADKLNEGLIPNINIYMRGALQTLYYLVISPIIISVISIILAFVSPYLSILSFILILILRFFIRMRKVGKDSKTDGLTDSEKEFLSEIEEIIY